MTIKQIDFKLHQVMHAYEIQLRPSSDSDIATHISAHYNLSPLTSRVLVARGFTPGPELDRYLQPSFSLETDNPSSIHGMEQAAILLNQAIENDQMIAIACDYDVDGLTGGAQLHSLLQAIGACSSVFVPDRFVDGYGLSKRIVQAASESGAKLLVCIDFGTNNQSELQYAKSLGLSTIVLDHHEVHEIPEACDVYVNPKQTTCGFEQGRLCASGLVWGLLNVLRKVRGKREEFNTADYLPFACLGTVCDMVPLTGMNRTLASLGLKKLQKTKNLGLRYLMRESAVNRIVKAYDLGFKLGPRINAAGRMLHGDLVISLLTTQSEQEALNIAKQLGELNRDRQEIEEKVKQFASKNISSNDSLPPALVVKGDDFHIGVVGIVAQRLVEMYHRPSVVLGVEAGMLKGSVRGIPGLNVVAALKSCSQFLEKFGGHEAAGGLSLLPEKFDDFSHAFTEHCREVLAPERFTKSVRADTVLSLREISQNVLNEFSQFEPFGMGNPTPQFLIPKLTICKVEQLKGLHSKMVFRDSESQYINGLWWRCKEHELLRNDNTVDVVARLDSSTYRGETEIVLNVQAIRKAQD